MAHLFGFAKSPLKRHQRWRTWPARENLARSRTAAAGRVERARLVWRARQGELGINAETVRRRIRRFNAEGLIALEDHTRSGRPATYSADAVAAVIAAALTSPRRLDLPFASWTLDRLAAYLRDHRGIAMRRSRIDEILLGLRWRRPGGLVRRAGRPRVRVRGGLRRSTPDRPRAASVSV